MTSSTAFKLSHPVVLIFLAATAFMAARLMVVPLECDTGFLGAAGPIAWFGSVVLAASAGLSTCVRVWGATRKGIMWGAVAAVVIGGVWLFVSGFFLLIAELNGPHGLFQPPCPA
jgi:hypothetical protein